MLRFQLCDGIWILPSPLLTSKTGGRRSCGFLMLHIVRFVPSLRLEFGADTKTSCQLSSKNDSNYGAVRREWFRIVTGLGLDRERLRNSRHHDPEAIREREHSPANEQFERDFPVKRAGRSTNHHVHRELCPLKDGSVQIWDVKQMGEAYVWHHPHCWSISQ